MLLRAGQPKIIPLNRKTETTVDRTRRRPFMAVGADQDGAGR